MPEPALVALAADLLAAVPERLVWTCLKEHPSAVWRVRGPAGSLVLKRHAHARAYAQEREALETWAPRLPAGSAPTLRGRDDGARLLALVDLPGVPAADVHAAHAGAGRFARALHDLDVPDPDPLPLVAAVAARLSAWDERSASLVTPAARAGLRRLTRGLDAFAGVRRVPCHRDFTPDNWLWGDPCLRVLDFEHARLDAAELDLVKLRADLWPARPDLARAFLDAYGPLSADASARLDVLLALHAAATLAWAARHRDPHFQALGERVLAVALARA